MKDLLSLLELYVLYLIIKHIIQVNKKRLGKGLLVSYNMIDLLFNERTSLLKLYIL